MAMNHSAKFIYLDIGDTLVAEANASLVMNALKLKEEIFRNSYQKFRTNMYKGKSSPSDFVENIKSNLNISPQEALEKWNSALISLSIIKPMHQLVKDLKGQYKIGILSNIFLGHFELFYNAGKIPNIHYDSIIRSCDIGFAKPEKEIYKIAQGKINVFPENIFFIDNKKEYVEKAIEYGWQGFVFDPKNPVESVSKLRKILL